MNKNINLCKILEGCEGVELWSPLCGKCIFSKMLKDPNYPIMVSALTNENKKNIVFTKEGHYHCLLKKGECVLFPSKDQRDWSKFERPIPIDTPMMYSDSLVVTDFNIGFYGGKDYRHYVYYNGKKSEGCTETCHPNFIIPFDDFNPNDIEESLKYNIQK